MNKKGIELTLTTIVVLIILLLLLVIVITFLSGNLSPMLDSIAQFMKGISGNLNETQI